MGGPSLGPLYPSTRCEWERRGVYADSRNHKKVRQPMTSEYVKPEDFPWFGQYGYPKPNLTGDILFGEQVITPRGNTVHRVEFRDLDHLQSHLEAALPWDRWCGSAGRESWVYDGSTRERTLEVWDKGIAPSQEIRREYEQLRDKVQAQFVSVDMRKCRAAKRKRVRSWAGGAIP